MQTPAHTLRSAESALTLLPADSACAPVRTNQFDDPVWLCGDAAQLSQRQFRLSAAPAFVASLPATEVCTGAVSQSPFIACSSLRAFSAPLSDFAELAKPIGGLGKVGSGLYRLRATDVAGPVSKHSEVDNAYACLKHCEEAQCSAVMYNSKLQLCNVYSDGARTFDPIPADWVAIDATRASARAA